MRNSEIQKFPGWNPYNFVLNRVIQANDPNGEKPIFVNGYLGFGSPKGGSEYWNPDFVTGAQVYLNDYQNPFYTNVQYSKFSSARQRYKAGMEYAKNNYKSLTEGMTKDQDVFNIITHSMGGAFGMGIKK